MCSLPRRIKYNLSIAIILLQFTCVSKCYAGNIFPEKFVNTFLIYYGGGDKFSANDVEKLAQYDLIAVDRFRYKNVRGNTWKALKNVNPDLKIMLYQAGPIVLDHTGKTKQYYLNNLGRYDNSRDHPMGELSTKADWFLKNPLGNTLIMNNNHHSKLLDFGNKQVHKYWFDATVEDILTKPWKADGIKIDNCSTFQMHPVERLMLKQSVKYPDSRQWDKALNSFVASVTKSLHQKNQLVMVNRTNVRLKSGGIAWLELDEMDDAPDIIMEEGAFAVSWGGGDVQFYSHDEWKRQIEAPGKIHNSSVALLSHTDLRPGKKGKDSDGNPVTFDQILSYSLGSYLLAKNQSGRTTLFSFDYGRKNGDYKRISWMDIYDSLDLGEAVNSAHIVNDKYNRVYVREFEKGYVYVNPTNNIQRDIPLHNPGFEIIRIDIQDSDVEMSEFSDNKFILKPHHALILLKVIKQ